MTDEALHLQFNDPEQDRAIWHLQLDPEQLYADAFPIFADEAEGDEHDPYWDYEEDDGFACTHCGGEGYCEVDDPLWDECDEFGYGPCGSCHGTGERRHQWVF